MKRIFCGILLVVMMVCNIGKTAGTTTFYPNEGYKRLFKVRYETTTEWTRNTYYHTGFED
jgi:hypothetical protein